MYIWWCIMPVPKSKSSPFGTCKAFNISSRICLGTVAHCMSKPTMSKSVGLGNERHMDPILVSITRGFYRGTECDKMWMQKRLHW